MNFCMFRELDNQFWLEDVCKLSIFIKNFSKSFISFQVSYLNPLWKTNFITWVYTEGSYVYYEGFIYQVKSYCYKLFLLF